GSYVVQITNPRVLQRVEFTGSTIDIPLVVQKTEGRISGRVMLEQPDGTIAPYKLDGVGLLAFTGDANPFVLSIRSGSDGTFDISHIPDRYILSATRGLPQDYYVESIHQGTRDVLRDGIVLWKDTAGMEVLISAAGAVVSGTVKDASGKAVHDATVALI